MSLTVDEIINRLDGGKLFSFPGGVHPEQRKALSNSSPISCLELPAELYIPIKQHIGVDGQCIVNVGDNVQQGQPLTESAVAFGVPVHAPTSGTITAITTHTSAHPSVLQELCVVLQPDHKQSVYPNRGDSISNIDELDNATLLSIICDAGIAGMGGAGFPTHIKSSPSKAIEFLIINGIECEPYITADDCLMREHSAQILEGVDILAKLTHPKVIIIAIEDNKPEALNQLRQALQQHNHTQATIKVVSVPTKYPAGGEKQLVQVVTGREVPKQGLPSDVGVAMFNVGTCYAIADAVLRGKPLTHRVVTVTGGAIASPQNFWVPLGTPVEHVLQQAGYDPIKQGSTAKIIMGGPMMGFTINDPKTPIIKTTNCLLAPALNELSDGINEQPCIRCSACADACPASLLPQQLFWHSKADEFDKAQDYNLFDCIECGACAYVCPSEIPLVHYYRRAKAQIRAQQEEKQKSEKAKQRFEERKARLEREKLEREQKHEKAKAARIQAAEQFRAETENCTVPDNAVVPPTIETAPADDKKANVAAAIARAKAKKLAAQGGQSVAASPVEKPVVAAPAEPTEPTQSSDGAANDDKKAKVAAAIARAKAKKLAAQKASEEAKSQSVADE